MYGLINIYLLTWNNTVFLFTINFIISFGISKLSKYVRFSAFTYYAIQWVLIDLNSSRFITYIPFFILG